MRPLPQAAVPRVGLVMLMACGAVAGSCGRASAPALGLRRVGAQTVIQTRGSDSMSHVAALWAEEYRGIAPDVEVEVSGGGSATGFAALIEGAVEIANASRAMLPKELAAAAAKHPGRPPRGTIVGYDALAVFVHKANPLDAIHLDQLRQVYAEGGLVSRWSQLGIAMPQGVDDAIVLVSRQSSSGTYEFFREHVLGNHDFRQTSHELGGSKEVVSLVAVTPGAIGFGGMGYATSAVKTLRVSARAGGPGYAPTITNTINHKYPLARPLILYTLGDPQGPVKAYVDWVLSDAGQQVLETCGYAALPPNRRSEAAFRVAMP